MYNSLYNLDSSVGQLAELALSEMFGITAEEKDVKKITGIQIKCDSN